MLTHGSVLRSLVAIPFNGFVRGMMKENRITTG